MKKIWMMLFAIGLTFTAIFSVFLFSNREEYSQGYLDKYNRHMITVNHSDSSEVVEVVLKRLNEIAIENKVNLYRKLEFYDEKSKYNNDIYVAISDESKVKKTLYIGENENLKGDFNLDRNDIKDFNNLKVVVRPFMESKDEGLMGNYFVQSDDESAIKAVLEEFRNLGLEYNTIEFPPLLFNLGYTISQTGITPLIISLGIFLLSFVFISLYEISLRFKEISIYKLQGYRLFKVFGIFITEKLVYIAGLNLIAIVGLGIYDTISKNGNRLVAFLLFSLVVLAIYTVAILFIYGVSFLIARTIVIKDMIKGNKPLKLIGNVSYFGKYSFNMILIVLVFLLISKVGETSEKYKALNEFEKYKRFSVTRALTIFDESKEKEVDKKLEKFYEIQAEKTFFLQASDYFIKDEAFERDAKAMNLIAKVEKVNYPIVTVSPSYFKYENVAGVNLSKLQSDSEYKLKVLLPENNAYDREELKQKIIATYIADKLGFSTIEESKSMEAKVEVEFMEYKGHKQFLFEHDNFFGKEQYGENPIYVLYSPKNISGQYAAMLYSNGRVFMDLGENSNYKSIRDEVKGSGLEENLTDGTNVYRYVAAYINNYEKEERIYRGVIAVVAVVWMLINAFSSITYLEGSKKLIIIKKLHGYNFLERHKGITAIYTGIAALVTAGVLAIYGSKHMGLTLGILVFDFTISLILLKLFENREIVKTMKGA